mmetsp:Transcript_74208/g.198019  ORF Transcript_74208/g.198019 Transcript_74208/m.198019 type:complete len:1001 (-) Transcript_74208:963-3965(-)
MFVRFQSDTWHEKLSKTITSDLFLDLKYSLYAADRRASQLSAGINLGKDSISAINLMEVSMKLDQVHKKHKECASYLAALWKAALKCKRSSSGAEVDQWLSLFDSTSNAICQTKKSYEELLLKFPGSVSLHRDYAHFCEVILNDQAKADQQIRGADILENDSAVGDDNQSQSRSNPSSATSHETLQRKYMDSWRHRIMGKQDQALQRLRFLVISLGVLLIAYTACSYVVQDTFVVSNLTVNRLKYLDSTVGYLSTITRACVSSRNMFLAANGMNLTAQTFYQAQSSLSSGAASLDSTHTSNFVSSDNDDLQQYFRQTFFPELVAIPSPDGKGSYRPVTVSFWDLINDYVSDMQTAAAISMSELQNQDYTVNNLSAPKRAMVSLMNNYFQVADAAQAFTDVVVGTILHLDPMLDNYLPALVCAHALSLLVLSFFVLKNVKMVFPTCQHAAVAGDFLHSLPLDILGKVHKYYSKTLSTMDALEDEALAKELVECSRESDSNGSDVEIVISRHDVAARRSTSPSDLKSGFYSSGLVNQSRGKRGSTSRRGRYRPVSSMQYSGSPTKACQSREILCSQSDGSNPDVGRGEHGDKKPENAEEIVCPQVSLALLQARQPSRDDDSDSCRTCPDEYDDSLWSGSGGGVTAAQAGDDHVSDAQADDESYLSDNKGGSHFGSSVGDDGLAPVPLMYVASLPSCQSSELHGGRARSRRSRSRTSRESRAFRKQSDVRQDLETGGDHWPGSSGKRLRSSLQSAMKVGFASALLPGVSAKGGDEKNNLIVSKTILSVTDSDSKTSFMDTFSTKLKNASKSNLAWYFKTPVYVITFTVIFAMCFPLWLAPRRLILPLINTSLLQRSARHARYLVLRCVLVGRGLALNDGFSRVNNTYNYQSTLKIRSLLAAEVDNFRNGGSSVLIGADNLQSDAMATYFQVMYQPGCPWRTNTSDCSLKSWPQAASQGLYQLLTLTIRAMDLVATKYAPDPADPSSSRIRCIHLCFQSGVTCW